MSEIDSLERLAKLHTDGKITNEEFAAAKEKLLSEDGKSKSKMKGCLAWVAVLVALVVGGLLVYGSSPDVKERSQARQVIELCWEDYKTSKLRLDARVLLAAACEKLEDDFQSKYGRKP